MKFLDRIMPLFAPDGGAGDGGAGGSGDQGGGGGNPPPNVLDGNVPSGQQTPEQIAAAAAAKTEADKAAADKAAAEKAETERRAKLTPEQRKAEDDAKAKQEADKKKNYGAPEGDYAAFKVPEGVVIEEALVKDFAAIAKADNLSQEGAQRYVDLFQKYTAEQAQKAADAEAKQWNDTLENWRKQGQDDPETGGQNYEANRGLANAVIAAYGGPKFVEAMTVTGMANHPELLRFAMKLGKAIGEDKLKLGGGSAQAQKSLADRVYGTPNK